MAEQYVSRCQFCGKIGTKRMSNKDGVAPMATPTVPGKCPCHPSGNPNMPHSPKWERA